MLRRGEGVVKEGVVKEGVVKEGSHTEGHDSAQDYGR